MKTNNLIVKDSCLHCKGLYSLVEFGSCGCNEDVSKSLTEAERSWLNRHGRLYEIEKPLKTYRMVDVAEPLKKLNDSMDALAFESKKLLAVAKGLNERGQRRKIRSKIRNAKVKIEYTISGVEKNKAVLENTRKESLRKSDNIVVLGVLDGSMKSLEIQGWIEKRAGIR
jgi:hypothetical protein